MARFRCTPEYRTDSFGTMTPPRGRALGCTNGATRDAVVLPHCTPVRISRVPFFSCKCLLGVCLAFICSVARGFVLKLPDISRYDHPCGVATRRIAHNHAIVPRPRNSVCRAAGEGGLEGEAPADEGEGDVGEGSGGDKGVEATGKFQEGGGEEEEEELTLEEKAKREAKIDWDDDDALWRAFPNPPKPPTPVLPDARDLTLEQMSEGEFEVSYGGQPSARRAIEEFEREERSRIHLATARRVLRYNLVQQQTKETRETLELEQSAAAVARIMLDDDDVAEDDRDPKWNKVFPWEGMVEAEYEWLPNPELITFSAFGLLYNWVIPVGNIFRDALGRAYGHRHRLPGPERFAFNFENSFKEADYHMPCFGQRLNVSSFEWWFHVYTDTYLKTMLDYDMPEELITDKMDEIADELYYEIMVGPEAFEPVPHVKVVLDTLAGWRDNGGPKLAVVANSDERLNVTLENLGLLPYFDFVLTSQEACTKVNEVDLYDRALEMAGVDDPAKAIHFGSDYDLDVVGPSKAGWETCLVKPRQPDYEQPGEIYQYHRLMRISEILHRYGLPGAEMPVLFRRRGNFWEEPDESNENNPDLLGA